VTTDETKGNMKWGSVSVVFPSLILNYAGQSASVLEGASTADNIFYRLCPGPLLIPFRCPGDNCNGHRAGRDG
jgi:K+ transporter